MHIAQVCIRSKAKKRMIFLDLSIILNMFEQVIIKGSKVFNNYNYQ